MFRSNKGHRKKSKEIEEKGRRNGILVRGTNKERERYRRGRWNHE
jgi:hypothetical protein